jgi:hypothetical protein
LEINVSPESSDVEASGDEEEVVVEEQKIIEVFNSD